MEQSKSNNGLSDEQFEQPGKGVKYSENFKNAILSADEVETNKIYLLKRIYSVGYDEYAGKVVIAPSAKAARKLANLKFGDEGPIWTDSNLVLCKKIDLIAPLVVLEAFKAG